jgi:predicted CoA-substrate-specific enzyme activase
MNMSVTNINPLCIGLDVGSTTVKIIILDSITQQIHVAEYQRHYAEVFQTLNNLMRRHLANWYDRNFTVTITGSAGIGIAENLQLPFVQEVIANMEAVTVLIPQTNIVIELGGEDAKIMFLDGCIDLRMNETCAGGTGAFIDQIAATLKTDAAGINEFASRHQKIYPIAARCGVFTKSDVTMLLNEGATKEDVAASVLQAIVEQTIGGLACGRKIQGNVAFLGGPLHFLPELRRLFIETLKLTPEQAVVPDNAHFFVALGAALLSAENKETLSATDILQFMDNAPQRVVEGVSVLTPLFATEEEYEQFQMIQLTSFGCGLDAVVAEQVAEILHSVGKPHTLLKIDEGTQLGAVKIRIRSLLSTMQQTHTEHFKDMKNICRKMGVPPA